MTDYYDGPKEGIADVSGLPHHYEAEWSEANQQFGPWFLLTPIDDETLQLALEEREIWLRWRTAFEAGKTTMETHPALTEDRQRWEIIRDLLKARFVANRHRTFRAKAEFRGVGLTGVRPGDCFHLKVRWQTAKENG